MFNPKVVLFILLSFSMNANAATDATYGFIVNATLFTGSCEITSSNLTFNLKVDAANLFKPGDASDWQPLAGDSIKLINCSPNIDNVEVAVSGTPDTDDSNGFINQALAADIPAGGVSVQLESGNTVLPNNHVLTASVDKLTGIIDIPLAARLYTQNGNAVEGNFLSVINLTLTYH